MTPAEHALWSHLRRQRLVGRWRRQHTIRGFIADFYCPALGVVIEVDGGVHETQVAEDIRRDDALTRLGLIVVHLTNDDVLARTEATLRLLRDLLSRLPSTR